MFLTYLPLCSFFIFMLWLKKKKDLCVKIDKKNALSEYLLANRIEIHAKTIKEGCNRELWKLSEGQK